MQDRLTLLEQKVSQLEATPVSVLRVEMREEFASVRKEFANVREEFANVREEMRLRGEALEQRMEQGFDETRRHARILYEDLVSRIATIGEGGPVPRRRARRKP